MKKVIWMVTLVGVFSFGWSPWAEASPPPQDDLAPAVYQAPPPDDLAPRDDYAGARARAIAENKPLVVWVGGGDAVCPSCVKGITEAVHFITPTFPEVTGQALVVGVPEDGDLVRVADITQWVTGDPSWGHTPSIRRAISNWRTHRRTVRGGWSMDLAVLPFRAAVSVIREPLRVMGAPMMAPPRMQQPRMQQPRMGGRMFRSGGG